MTITCIMKYVYNIFIVISQSLHKTSENNLHQNKKMKITLEDKLRRNDYIIYFFV
jgi:hypothetical protein